MSAFPAALRELLLQHSKQVQRVTLSLRLFMRRFIERSCGQAELRAQLYDMKMEAFVAFILRRITNPLLDINVTNIVDKEERRELVARTIQECLRDLTVEEKNPKLRTGIVESLFKLLASQFLATAAGQKEKLFTYCFEHFRIELSKDSNRLLMKYYRKVRKECRTVFLSNFFPKMVLKKIEEGEDEETNNKEDDEEEDEEEEDEEEEDSDFIGGEEDDDDEEEEHVEIGEEEDFLLQVNTRMLDYVVETKKEIGDFFGQDWSVKRPADVLALVIYLKHKFDEIRKNEKEKEEEEKEEKEEEEEKEENEEKEEEKEEEEEEEVVQIDVGQRKKIFDKIYDMMYKVLKIPDNTYLMFKVEGGKWKALSHRSWAQGTVFVKLKQTNPYFKEVKIVPSTKWTPSACFIDLTCLKTMIAMASDNDRTAEKQTGVSEDVHDSLLVQLFPKRLLKRAVETGAKVRGLVVGRGSTTVALSGSKGRKPGSGKWDVWKKEKFLSEGVAKQHVLVQLHTKKVVGNCEMTQTSLEALEESIDFLIANVQYVDGTIMESLRKVYDSVENLRKKRQAAAGLNSRKKRKESETDRTLREKMVVVKEKTRLLLEALEAAKGKKRKKEEEKKEEKKKEEEKIEKEMEKNWREQFFSTDIVVSDDPGRDGLFFLFVFLLSNVS